MELATASDAAAVPAAVDRFLAERVERNLLATVLAARRGGGRASTRLSCGRTLFGWLTGSGGEVRAVLLRTAPRPLLCSALASAEAPALLAAWMREDPGLPGVSAETATARALAAAWERVAGRAAQLHMSEAMHVLTEVRDPARPARGGLRRAGRAEHELLVEWERAFVAEARVGAGEDAERAVDGRLAAGAQLVWDDGGAVCTVGAWPAVAGTVRLGPVYTPPEHRCGGYATSAVAAASRLALAAGAERCMLFTGLANPTSNRIYARVGFKPTGSWEWYAFPPAGAA